jgi:outer membrane immunogenic protein
MRKLLIAAVALGAVGFAPAALGQGAPVYNWTGFYVGAHAGYGWGSGDHSFTDYPAGAFAFPFSIGQVPRSIGTDPDGFVGGGHVGYNWQVGARGLIGIEGDLSAANIRGGGSRSFAEIPFVANATFSSVHQSLDWLATVRARAGVTFDRLLVYATAGVAFGGVESSFLVSAPAIASTIGGQSSDTLAGWTAGAGAEYAFAGNWSARVQWLYYDLGDISMSGPQVAAGVAQPFGLNATADTRGHIVTLGISYRFGAPAAP